MTVIKKKTKASATAAGKTEVTELQLQDSGKPVLAENNNDKSKTVKPHFKKNFDKSRKFQKKTKTFSPKKNVTVKQENETNPETSTSNESPPKSAVKTDVTESNEIKSSQANSLNEKNEKRNSFRKNRDQKGGRRDPGKKSNFAGKREFGQNSRNKFTNEQQKEMDELRQSLESQGAPKDVINAAMHRKFRGILRRNKRTFQKQTGKVCLSCRKPGHLVRDCPQASTETGCCFKCGSKEHTSRECPNKSDNYAFATCYICKEKGHLAKHCKQNSHGLYVRGGSCHYCGDIRHFARDCPNKNRNEGEDNANEEAENVLVATRTDVQESADADVNEGPSRKKPKTDEQKKVVKF